MFLKTKLNIQSVKLTRLSKELLELLFQELEDKVGKKNIVKHLGTGWKQQKHHCLEWTFGLEGDHDEMLTSYIRQPRSEYHLHSQFQIPSNADPGEAVVMVQIVGYLLSLWETCTEVQTPSFGPVLVQEIFEK